MVLIPYSFPIAGGGGGSGGGSNTTVIYNAVVQAKSVAEFPATGKGNLVYIDTTANEFYYWNDIEKKYVKMVSKDDEPPKEEKPFIVRASLKEWQEKNPILENGVIGYVIDDNSAKIGDSVTNWNNLPWFVKPIEIPECNGLTVDDIYNACVSGKGLSAPLYTSNEEMLVDDSGNNIQYNFKLKIK